jgi:hypothetical protein
MEGIGAVGESDQRPLTDAENTELARQKRILAWRRILDTAAIAVVVLGLLGGSKVNRHTCDVAFLVLGGAAVALKFVTSRQ